MDNYIRTDPFQEPEDKKKALHFGSFVTDTYSSLQSKWFNSEPEYKSPIVYCDVEGVKPEKITGVRQTSAAEPTFIDVMHDRAARLLYGGALEHGPDENSSYDRPCNMTAKEKRLLEEAKREKKRARKKAKEIQENKKKEEEMKAAWTVRTMTTCQERLEEIGYGLLDTPVTFDQSEFPGSDPPFFRNYDYYCLEKQLDDDDDKKKKEKKPSVKSDDDDQCIFDFDDL